MNKVRSFRCTHVPSEHHPPTISTSDAIKFSSPRGLPDGKYSVVWGTMLRYGYQAAHKTVLALPPYARASRLNLLEQIVRAIIVKRPYTLGQI